MKIYYSPNFNKIKVQNILPSKKMWNEFLKIYQKNHYLLGSARAEDMFSDVHTALNGDLENKLIVDLGSGSSNDEDSNNGMFEPWLCRLITIVSKKHNYNLRCIAVDAGEFTNEGFECQTVDLRYNDPILEEKSVDLFVSYELIHSPSLYFNRKHMHDRIIEISKKYLKNEGNLIIGYINLDELDKYDILNYNNEGIVHYNF